MISGLTYAARAIPEHKQEYLGLAEKSFDFIVKNLRQADGSMIRTGYVDQEGNYAKKWEILKMCNLHFFSLVTPTLMDLPTITHVLFKLALICTSSSLTNVIWNWHWRLRKCLMTSSLIKSRIPATSTHLAAVLRRLCEPNQVHLLLFEFLTRFLFRARWRRTQSQLGCCSKLHPTWRAFWSKRTQRQSNEYHSRSRKSDQQITSCHASNAHCTWATSNFRCPGKTV